MGSYLLKIKGNHHATHDPQLYVRTCGLADFLCCIVLRTDCLLLGASGETTAKAK